MTAPGIAEPLTYSIDEQIDPPETESSCYYSTPETAPFFWEVPLLQIMYELWGGPIVVHSLGAGEMRDYAVSMLGYYTIRPQAAEIVPALIRALADANAGVRQAAVQSLRHFAPESFAAVPALVYLLENEQDEALVEAIAETLGQFGPESADAVSGVIRLMNETDSWLTQQTAVETLGQIGPPAAEAVPALIEIANRQYELPPLRAAAVLALGGIGPVTEEVIPTLISALDAQDTEMRAAAVLALAQIGAGTEGAIPGLIRMLEEDDEEAREAQRSAAWLLGEMGPAAVAAVPTLAWVAENCFTNCYDVRVEAVRALGRIGPDAAEAVPALERMLAVGPEHWGAQMIAPLYVALWRIGARTTEDAVTALVQLLDGEDTRERFFVVGALGDMGPAAAGAIPALIQILNTEVEIEPAPSSDAYMEADARGAIARALGQIGPQTDAVIPALIEMSHDLGYYPYPREGAIEALGNIGPAAIDATPDLIQALGDESGAIRKLVAESLTAITGESYGEDVAAWQQWWEDRPE